MKLLSAFLILSVATASPAAAEPDEPLASAGLVIDLDAARGVVLGDDQRVEAWRNQAAGDAAREFRRQDEGREVPGSGRPTLRPEVAALGGKPAIVFRRQELVSTDDRSLDGLTTGDGLTFLVVVAPHPQRAGLKDVNSFFGNLRNGDYYEGFWANFTDDNRFWIGARNGRSFGRFDVNNPQLMGPKLETGTFHVVGGRLAAGSGECALEIFHGSPQAFGSVMFPVNPEANPSRPAIGQERDAVEHPGHESFDGEIARFLLWGRPLADAELAKAIDFLKRTYRLE